MASNKGECRCGTPARFYPIWRANPDVKHQLIRFILTIIGVAVTLFCICLISILSDSFYIPAEHPALADRIHDQILHRREMPMWITVLVDVCTFLSVFLTCFRHLLLLPFPLNLQVLSRFCTMVILGFWMRALAIVVTTVPPSKPNCIPRRPQTVGEVLAAAMKQAAAHNVECAGMIISGHSLNVMHSFMSWVFYGRCQSAPEKQEKRRGFYCRDVTCRGEPYDTLKGCFLYQCGAFFKTWYKLSRGGCTSPMRTAAARCFSPAPIEEPEVEAAPHRGALRKVWGAITRLPLLRYYCYIQALVVWILIPMCYNHYTIDVYLAVMFGLLWWIIYHLILTIQLVQKRGTSEKWTPPGNSLCLKCNSLAPQSTDWRSAGSGDPSGCSKASPAGELAVMSEGNVHNINVSIQRDTEPDGGASEEGREQSGSQGAANERGDTRDSVSKCNACFANDFDALNLSWILDFPILQPISWCIRKMEGI